MVLAVRLLPVLGNAAANRFVKKADQVLKVNRKLDLPKKSKLCTLFLKRQRFNKS